MLLRQLTCETFRSFDHLCVEFNDGLQRVTGENGSGKSSLLEAIVYSTTGRSFRSARSSHLVSHGADLFRIWLDLPNDRTLAVEKHSSGRSVLRSNESVVRSITEFARLLPIIFIDTHTHRLFSEEAKHRRQLIDWMMFHVKHQAYQDWLQYQQALKQRNECLKQGGYGIEVWDELLDKYGTTVSEVRSEIYHEWRKIFDAMAIPFDWTGDLGYKRGWADDITLLESLRQTKQNDMRRGFTTTGAHRFDIIVQEYDNMAYHVLSQGQQKVLNGFMRIAAAEYVKVHAQKPSLWLIDDLPAELDTKRQDSWLKQLENGQDQVIITALPQTKMDIPIILTLDKENV